MTPYELNLIVESLNEKLMVEKDEKIILVWLNEYWHRQKKLPPLKKALEDVRGKENEPMSDEEMLEMVKMLNLQFGGTTEKGG